VITVGCSYDAIPEYRAAKYESWWREESVRVDTLKKLLRSARQYVATEGDETLALMIDEALR